MLSARYSGLRLNDLAALQALRANAHPLAAGADFGPDRAKVHVPAPLGDVVGVADVVSRLRLFAADCADLCHGLYLLRSNSEGLTAKGNFRAWCVKDRFYRSRGAFDNLSRFAPTRAAGEPSRLSEG